MSRDQGSSDIDATTAGSGVDGADGVAEQLDAAETLDDRGVVDFLDEGYSPPDREPSIHVPTEREGEQGLSLDELLAAEVPDVGVDDGSSLFDEDGEEVGDLRAGRLVDSDGGAYPDTEKELWAGDVGIDGGAASAEEAAMHVISDEED